jgi:hypothetical protein
MGQMARKCRIPDGKFTENRSLGIQRRRWVSINIIDPIVVDNDGD